MCLKYFPQFISVIALLLFSYPPALYAQSNVWAGKQLTSDKAKKGKDKLKDWKDHLQKWGLDSNYNHELDLGAKLNTNGWSGCVYLFKKVSKRQLSFWQLGFSEIKDEKQVKQQGSFGAFPQLGNPSSYIFGKINNLYALQLGYGRQTILLPDVLEGNISVSFRYNGGFSLAMLKPYYLKLINVDYSQPNDPATVQQQKYSSANADKFLNTGYVFGAGSWSKGLNEMEYIPGAYLEGAFVITPGNQKAFIENVTLGGNIAYYAKDLPIMADRPAYNLQACLFVGLSLGKRWR
ncbi:MAG TPA: hypothetical protein VN721_06480 [Flavipsychrobacter sp.]|nr:hypothetical protein [Flavipsychrobacter sp.]